MAVLYDPELTANLPPGESGRTALNALPHCPEALYVPRRNDQADAEALQGAHLISRALPRVLPARLELAAAFRGRYSPEDLGAKTLSVVARPSVAAGTGSPDAAEQGEDVRGRDGARVGLRAGARGGLGGNVRELVLRHAELA